MKIERILTPVDFSDCSEKALNWAATIAEQWSSHVYLCHIIPQPSYPSMFGGGELVTFETELQSIAETQLQELVGKLQSKNIQTTIRISLGEPFHDICRIAEEEHMDLIVMGTHGRTGLSHALLGSVAERVVRYASCPVLVVGKEAAL